MNTYQTSKVISHYIITYRGKVENLLVTELRAICRAYDICNSLTCIVRVYKGTCEPCNLLRIEKPQITRNKKNNPAKCSELKSLANEWQSARAKKMTEWR